MRRLKHDCAVGGEAIAVGLRDIGRDQGDEVGAAGAAGRGVVEKGMDEHARAGEVVGCAGFGEGVGGEEDGVGVG